MIQFITYSPSSNLGLLAKTAADGLLWMKEGNSYAASRARWCDQIWSRLKHIIVLHVRWYNNNALLNNIRICWENTTKSGMVFACVQVVNILQVLVAVTHHRVLIHRSLRDPSKLNCLGTPPAKGTLRGREALHRMALLERLCDKGAILAIDRIIHLDDR